MEKSRVSTSVTSSPVKKEEHVSHTHMYLMPGALAQTLQEKRLISTRRGCSSHDSLKDLKSSAEILNQTHMHQMPMDGVPSFPYPRRFAQFSPSCGRKKLFAAAATFSNEF